LQLYCSCIALAADCLTFYWYFLLQLELLGYQSVKISLSAIQGHTRSLIVAQMESEGVCDFLLVINSYLGPIWHLSEIRRVIG